MNNLTFNNGAYKLEKANGEVYEGVVSNLVAHFLTDTITITDRVTLVKLPIITAQSNDLQIGGQTKTFEQIKTIIETELAKGGGASSADAVSYDNTTSGLQSTNVQDAIDEVGANLGEFQDDYNTTKSKVDGLMDVAEVASVQAQNVGYQGAVSGVTNVKGAIDKLVGNNIEKDSTDLQPKLYYTNPVGSTVSLGDNNTWRHIIVAVNKGDIVSVKGIGGTSARLLAFVKDNKVVANCPNTDYSSERYIYEVPSDGGYIYCNTLATNESIFSLKIESNGYIDEKIENATSETIKKTEPNIDCIYQPYKGKNVFFAGDSQTMYGYYFAEFLRTTGMTMIGNTGQLGNGGRTIELKGFLETMDAQSMIDWGNIDVLTILVGGNDYDTNTPKGSFNDGQSNTIYGGIQDTIRYIKGKNKNIEIVFFTRPERDNVQTLPNANSYVTTTLLSGISSVTYSGATDYVAIAGYDNDGRFVRNILTSGTYSGEVVTIPNDCPKIRISSKASYFNVYYSFALSDGTTITSANIETYREKSYNGLPNGKLISDGGKYNFYIYENGYWDNRIYHFAPNANNAGLTIYDINKTIIDCAERMGCVAFDTHSKLNITFGYNLRDVMPDGTHFNQELGARIGKLMGHFINTLK